MLADQTEAGDQYRFILSAIQRSREEAIAQTQSGALQRGVLRSGIYLGDEAKVNQEFASQESAAAADKAFKLNAIQQAIAGLESQFAEGRAGTSAGVVQQQLESMRMLAQSLAADDALSQRAAGVGYTGSPGQGGTLGGAAGISNIQTDRARQMVNAGSGQLFGAGDFLDVRPTNQVIGGNGDGTFNYGGGGQIGAGAMAGNAGTLGKAYYGNGVSVADFYSSLAPQVQAGFTPQDLLNMAQFYENGIIPGDAAFNIASRAAYIGR